MISAASSVSKGHNAELLRGRGGYFKKNTSLNTDFVYVAYKVDICRHFTFRYANMSRKIRLKIKWGILKARRFML